MNIKVQCLVIWVGEAEADSLNIKVHCQLTSESFYEAQHFMHEGHESGRCLLTVRQKNVLKNPAQGASGVNTANYLKYQMGYRTISVRTLMP